MRVENRTTVLCRSDSRPYKRSVNEAVVSKINYLTNDFSDLSVT